MSILSPKITIYGFFDHIEKLKSNKILYIKLLSTLGSSAILNNKNDIFKSKIIWLSSFLQEDTSYISNFLDFYNRKAETSVGDIEQYEDKLISILNNITKIENLKFSDFVEQSYFYQYLILYENTNPIKFIRNKLPFFSSKNNFNFTKNTHTNSYNYVIDNPITSIKK